ncbi:MAG: hypothetical protein ACOC1F_05990 [Myxococcota bacterium]
MIYLDLGLLLVTSIPLLLLIHASVQERAPRAVAIALAALVVNAALWLGLAHLAGHPAANGVHVAVVSFVAVAAGASLLRIPATPRRHPLDRIVRFDERDHMFARNNLRRHPDLAERYYAEHPEKRPIDERIGKRPELGEPGGRYYDPVQTPLAAAAFAWLDRSRHLASAPSTGHPANKDVDQLADQLTRIAKAYGAVDVGITPLQDHHVYARRGRQAERWGDPIERQHATGVVIVVAMDHAAMAYAPDAPVIVESSRQYVESARLAHVMAELLRTAGHDARAHVDGNYEVLCVPPAADAGLGEVGRMSIFMHRTYGPCVRLAVVTTTAPLPSTEHPPSGHVEAFCDICKKCSDNCPSRAIAPGGACESRAFVHWSIDQEACYGMWRTFGTDCALCIRVCPFSKPNTPVHQLARWYVARNGLNRRIALWADDLLYGRRVGLPPARHR